MPQPPRPETQTGQRPADQLPEPAAKPEKRAPARRVSPKTGPEPAVEAAPSPVQPKPEIPQLGPMISDSQMRDLSRAIDAALSSTEQNLRAVRSRERNSRQQKLLDQAEGFARQARETRAADPVAARSLADRADQLSRELAASYR